jgi:hypothetical protein
MTVFSGSEILEVVGESHYQDSLWWLVGGHRSDRIRHPVTATLEPEPDNPVDANAIKIVIDGRCVGYLSRDDASAYLGGLLRLIDTCDTGVVGLRGQIVGGGEDEGRLGFLGVFLDHDPLNFGLAPHYTSGGRLRTGLSDALASDLADDSYDLSWLRLLSTDDLVAADQLRELLTGEPDPIDRHYMFSELETRLYRARDRSESALDEFDTACRQHDREMSVIRPALLLKFGAVPVIEMYRQAAIRAQKAKAWDDAQRWAERGIAVYGDQAARPEVVDDLRKRLAYAAAKMSRGDAPSRAAPRSTSQKGAGEPVLELLVCRSCGSSFERVRTRGRKPTLCPSCRGPVSGREVP